MLTFGSLFAGIGGFDLGFHRAGLRCAWQVEIDAAARSVLARHPETQAAQFEDVRSVGAHNLTPVDIICGGFPCQDLSVAGKRTGLAGARSGLFYEMTRITDELRPAFLIWENVPGLLSSRCGRDFLSVLMELERIGYSGCWTTLDAQWFGVAQRRQRIFGVFARRDIGTAVCAEILSLTARLPWNTEARRTARPGVAASVTASAGHHGRSSPRGDGSDNLISVFGGNDTCGERGVAAALTSHGSGRYDFESENFVCGALGAVCGGPDDNSAQAGHVVLAFTERTRAEGRTFEAQEDLAYALTNPGSGGRTHSRQIAGQFGVRRLTPLECERLQGFPDDWTAGQPDSTRYRQLGNAVAVPCARWIGQRIMEVL